MLIKNDFDVAQPVDQVWAFFEDIPQVAACLPGAELTEDLGDDTYRGRVAIRMGPVKLQFNGTADIIERDEAGQADRRRRRRRRREGPRPGRMLVTATLTRAGRGTRVDLEQDLQLSGAAAQYGRGMISDVTAVLMGDFATNMQNRIEAANAACRRTRSAAARVGERFRDRPAGRPDGAVRVFRALLPSLPAAHRELRRPTMVLWWIGNVVLLLVVVPVLVALLNRVLAALERIRGASDDILAGGVALIGELDGVPEVLADDRPDRQGRRHRRGPLRRLRREAPGLRRGDTTCLQSPG